MSRSEDTGRQPQFTNTRYEIPSWQTPWNKPWYQRTDSGNDELPKRYEYNSRGHSADCTCANCEEDLEKAFKPQEDTTRQTVSDIPRDRHEEVKIQVHLEDLTIKNGGDEIASASNSSFPTSSTPKKVYLFSELAEVKPTTSCHSLPSTGSSSASYNEISSPHRTTTNTNSHDSVMDLFDNITAIQSISEKTKDIQTRVYNYRGKSSTQEYRTMKELLESLRRELNRVNSNVEWFAVSKKMALEAIEKCLEALERRGKEFDMKK